MNSKKTSKEIAEKILDYLASNDLLSLNGFAVVQDTKEVELTIRQIICDVLMEKTKKTKHEGSETFNGIKNCFLDYYQEKFGVPYYFTPADAGAIRNLKSKIQTIFQTNETEKITGIFCFMVQNIKDKWIIDNLSFRMINHKFNEIVKSLGYGAEINTYRAKILSEIGNINTESSKE